MKARDLSIDTLRGLACLLLVAYHVIGSDPAKGLRLSEGVLRDLNDSLDLVRMPLFTFLSGYVYAARPFQDGLGRYMKGKARRLLAPMLTLGTLFAIVQALMPGANGGVTDWWTLHLIPVGHFWFVEALFMIFLLVALMERAGALSTPGRAGLAVALALLVSASPVSVPWLGINGVFYLMPYFLVGLSMRRFEVTRSATLGALLLAVVLCCIYVDATDIFDFGHRRSITAFVPAALFCVGAYMLKPRSAFLAYIGVYSYSIYLLHVFFTAGSRIGLKLLPDADTPMLFALGLVIGVTGPILADKLLSRWHFTRVYLLGKSKQVARPRAATTEVVGKSAA